VNSRWAISELSGILEIGRRLPARFAEHFLSSGEFAIFWLRFAQVCVDRYRQVRKGKGVMARFVKCEQCSFRFRPEPPGSDESAQSSGVEEVEIRCPRCDTIYAEPEIPPKYWRLYCLVGLAAGVFVAGGMLLNSWLNSDTKLNSGPVARTNGQAGDAAAAFPEASPDDDRPEPVLPGAVTAAPQWLDSGGPFNPQDLFAPLEPERNAAPLYLEALIGFSSELAVCVPKEFREPAMSNARERSQEFVALFRQWKTTPQSVDVTALELCLAGYSGSFAELAKAQRRLRCVFDSDLNLFSEQRHVNAAREAANVASLRIQRTMRDGGPATRKVGAEEATQEVPLSVVEKCLTDMERILRLSRDLRPRGRIETQRASLAIDQTMLGLVPALVARSELTVADCDRITKLLTRHRAESMNPYVEGLRAEYLLLRSLLQDLRIGTGLLPETRLANEVSDGGRHAPVADAVSPGYLLASKANADNVAGRAAEIDAKVRTFTTEEFETERDTMDAIWTELFKVSNTAAGLRRAATLAAEKKLLTDTAFLGALSKITELADQTTWWDTTLNSLHCVLAIRRWELEHTEPPPDLLTAVRRLGLAFVPIDPFDGGPLRVSFINEEAMIYSVGPDGVDDAGRKVVDSTDSEAKGDIVFRIPYHASSGSRSLKAAPGTTPAGF
jgi:hypothetical protein